MNKVVNSPVKKNAAKQQLTFECQGVLFIHGFMTSSNPSRKGSNINNM